jgi:hypothetical protein
MLIGLAVMWGMLGPSGRGWAYDSPLSRATLRGLQGVGVVIEAVPPHLEQAGLTTQQLHTEVEFRLRQGGIPVLTSDERLSMPGAPWLYVNAHVVLHADGLAAYHIDVEVYQSASLETDASLVTASTWSVGVVN